MCFCFPLLGAKQWAQHQGHPVLPIRACPAPTQSASGEMSHLRHPQAHKVTGWSSKEGYRWKSFFQRHLGEALCIFPAVHRWRHRITLASISLSKLGFLLTAFLLPPHPSSPSAQQTAGIFVACLTSVEPIAFSKKRGQAQLPHTQSCLGREGSQCSSKHLPLHLRNTARPAENWQLC